MAEKQQYKYFVAHGASLAVIEDYIAQHKEANTAVHALINPLGADSYRRGTRVEGVIFTDPAKVPEGWRPSIKGDRSCYMPKRTNKAMKAVYDALREPTFPDGMWLCRQLKTDWCHTSEMGPDFSFVIRFPNFKKIGDNWIFIMPVDHEGKFGTPPDSIPLKTSEYWALVEKAEEAKEAA